MTAMHARVALHGIGLGGGVTDDEESLHLFVAPDARAEFEFSNAGFG